MRTPPHRSRLRGGKAGFASVGRHPGALSGRCQRRNAPLVRCRQTVVWVIATDGSRNTHAAPIGRMMRCGPRHDPARRQPLHRAPRMRIRCTALRAHHDGRAPDPARRRARRARMCEPAKSVRLATIPVCSKADRFSVSRRRPVLLPAGPSLGPPYGLCLAFRSLSAWSTPRGVAAAAPRFRSRRRPSGEARRLPVGPTSVTGW